MLPYYAKTTDKKGKKEPTKIETINKHDLQKYVNLVYDNPQAHRPYALGILLIDIDENTNNVTSLEPEQIYEKDFAKLIDNKLSIKNVFNEIENFKIYYTNKKI